MAAVVSNGGAPRNGATPLPHINDLTATPKDIDQNQSLKRLLEICESSLRSAEMLMEFKRPANALQDYLRAYVIAVTFVKGHRDYPTMQSNRQGELYRKHLALLSRIEKLYATYNGVKLDIIQDNKRTGVRPAAGGPNVPLDFPSGRADLPSSEVPRSQPPQTKGLAASISNLSLSSSAATGKDKPVPRPKPQSLHGNAIQNSHARSASNASNSSNDMLMARIAGLRGPQASPGQDPRIKTHSFTPPPRPTGPREMPASQRPQQRPQIGIDSSVSSLPKMPDAIYSPVRGNMSEESARLPSSTPRGPFSRTGSSTSVVGSPSASSQPPSKDYFTPTYTNVMSADPGSVGRPSTDLASTVSSPRRSLDRSARDNLELIEAEELKDIMAKKGTYLIIDMRSREEFDEGHIMSMSTICIEPHILAREGQSADDIAETLVLSPNQDDALFAKRSQYDLVVLYDQDSREAPKMPPRRPEEITIASLHRALVFMNYGHDLKQPPKLLKGGLDAWVDYMGAASLQATSASTAKAARIRALGRKRSKYVVKEMRPDDAKLWQEVIENDDKATATSPTFVRSNEEFHRRFPEIATEPESMSSPVPPPKPEKPPAYQPQNRHGDLPAPLARPAPAVSRPSHSGLSMGTDEQGGFNKNGTVVQQASGRAYKTPEQVFTPDLGFVHTGLMNPHNWCYANSIIQSLLACDFGRELTNSDWKKRYVVPQKGSEKRQPPQLMMQMVSNYFHWMASGKFETMNLKTLMEYARHVSISTNSQETFGDSHQHDAQEFMTFVLTHLDDETNPYRDVVDTNQKNPDQPNTQSQSLLAAAMEFWNLHSRTHRSIVDKYWRLLELGVTMCEYCGTESFNYRTVDTISPAIGDRDISLDIALSNHTARNKLDDYRCDKCNANRPATTWLCYPRMPPLLCVTLNRFGYNMNTRETTKSDARITWDLNEIDLSKLFLRPDDCSLVHDTNDKAFKGRFLYECFAIVEHSGGSPNSGHYTAYVRDQRTHDPSAWLYCNDAKVTKVRMDHPSERAKVFKQNQRVPYIAFFRRKFSS